MRSGRESQLSYQPVPSLSSSPCHSTTPTLTPSVGIHCRCLFLWKSSTVSLVLEMLSCEWFVRVQLTKASTRHLYPLLFSLSKWQNFHISECMCVCETPNFKLKLFFFQPYTDFLLYHQMHVLNLSESKQLIHIEPSLHYIKVFSSNLITI